LATQGEQIVKFNAESLLAITPEVLFNQRGSKAVKARGHCRVGGKQIPHPCCRQCNFEGLPSLLHEIAGTFKDGKRRMPFIEVTNVWMNSECSEKPPPSDSQHQFLFEAQFRASAI
jgi:hypothetical protein